MRRFSIQFERREFLLENNVTVKVLADSVEAAEIGAKMFMGYVFRGPGEKSLVEVRAKLWERKILTVYSIGMDTLGRCRRLWSVST